MSDVPTSAPKVGTLLALAWPIVLARATQAVVGFSDALMTAPLGEASLAAVTTGALDLLCCVMLPMGTLFILQSFAAQLKGRGDLASARRYAIYGLLLSVLASIPFFAIVPFLDGWVGSLGYASDVRTQMVTYLSLRIFSVPAILGLEALGNWYGGLGNTRVALVAGVVTMLTNVALNYALIEPHFGLPGYGAGGAAIASSIASWLGFLLAFSLFVNGQGHEAPRVPLTIRWSEVLRMLRFGLPTGLNYFLEFAAFMLFINVVVGHLGTTVLAAFNVVFQINSLSFMPAFGVASAGAILVGDSIGRGLRDRVWPIVKQTLVITALWMVSVGLVYVLFPATLMSVFATEAAPAKEMLAVGSTMLGLCGIWQLFDAISITLGEALRAAGDTAWPMMARILLAWFVFTPLGWTAVFLWGGGVITIMISLIIYLAALAGCLALRFATGRWKSIELVEEELPLD